MRSWICFRGANISLIAGCVSNVGKKCVFCEGNRCGAVFSLNPCRLHVLGVSDRPLSVRFCIAHVSEAGPFLKRIDYCITQLKAQGPDLGPVSRVIKKRRRSVRTLLLLLDDKNTLYWPHVGSWDAQLLSRQSV
jgi:hypothetical protein